ncbi:oxidoreductase HTATIP2-like [Paramacrobiotus metropolitanus]|uniref:oxidoreductase HTATIP2-like n=1 Tax=Paramacrobiotus metropolitanus TaxID=2943436 RepID=UPI002445C0D4|nr:oxidoreductase HTATIP2-like [Paramacrobiotus metropolitanus]
MFNWIARISTGIGIVAVLLAYLSFHHQVDPPIYAHTEMDALLQNFRQLNRSCFIVGASGESGKALLKEVVRLKPFARIVLISRRKLEYEDEELKKLEQRVIDFDKIDELHQNDFQGFDVGYSCLGTTRGKAGKEGFIKIEHDYTLSVAKAAKAGGTKHFQLVSSRGVDENSFFLYYQVKGQTDREVCELGFERVSIYRPAVLLVDRVERRPLEKVAQALLKPVAYIAPTFISTPIDILAKAMILNTINNGPPGAQIVDNKEIHQLGNSLTV